MDCPAFSSDREASRFAAAVGISERRIAQAQQCASDLCAHSADALLQQLHWERSSIGILLMITQSPDYGFPATAILLQHRLGLQANTIAYDINLGCSAFPFGLAQIASTMRSLGIRRGLLLIGDISSRGCHPGDPSSYPLFGDAGSAIALELDNDAQEMYFDLNSDGSGGNAIILKSSSLAGRYPINPSSLELGPCGDDGHLRTDLNTRLNGADIFSFSIRHAPSSIRAVMENSGLSAADFSYLVLHQANKMINDIVCRKAGFGTQQALSSLDCFGNTGSASIPVTLCLNAHKMLGHRKILACGFGVGLSWGSVILDLGSATKMSLIESDDVFRPDLLIEV